MASNTKRSGLEWTGGLVRVPAYVSEAGTPYRPDALFWLGPDGSVLSTELAKPGELLMSAAESLQRVIAQREHAAIAPSRVRVASPALCGLLRGAFPGLEIVCAPTPEIDALVELMREQFALDAAREPSYLSDAVDSDTMGAFFRAAACLYRAAPWQLIPSDQDLLTFSIHALGIRNAVLSVVGRLGKSVGLIVFPDYAAYEAYLRAGDALEHGQAGTMPAHFALHFERGAELGPPLRKQILKHGWEVATADAYPWLMAMDEDLVARPPTAAEVTLAEVLARALPRLLAEHRSALVAAWTGGAPVVRTLHVKAYAGTYAVGLQATDHAALQAQGQQQQQQRETGDQDRHHAATSAPDWSAPTP